MKILLSKNPSLRKMAMTMQAFVEDKIRGYQMSVFDYTEDELVGLAAGIFVASGIIESEESYQILLTFLEKVRANYSSNPYHSFFHAADVAYMCFYLLTDINLYHECGLSRLDLAVILISALTHDMQHPGTNNIYQIKAATQVATKYANESVLEKQSFEITRNILLETNVVNALSLGDRPDNFQELILASIETAILQTDMKNHIAMVEKLQALEKSAPFDVKSPPCDKQLFIDMILHAADISNAVRPFEDSKIWSELILSEFTDQNKLEREHQLTLSDFNLESPNKIQINFMKFVVDPLYSVMAQLFPGMTLLTDLLYENIDKWAEESQKTPDKRANSKPEIITTEKMYDIVERSKSLEARSTGGMQQRRISIAAGTLELSAELLEKMSGSEKKALKRVKPQKNSSRDVFGTTVILEVIEE